MNPLLLAFYGDDFTGSADSMEALTINGVRTALFLGHPTRERLQENLGNLDAVGISGVSRTMTPAQMDEELPPQLTLLDSLGAPLLHYKVCATFDSSPAIGSLGHATVMVLTVVTAVVRFVQPRAEDCNGRIGTGAAERMGVALN